MKYKLSFTLGWLFVLISIIIFALHPIWQHRGYRNPNIHLYTMAFFVFGLIGFQILEYKSNELLKKQKSPRKDLLDSDL